MFLGVAFTYMLSNCVLKTIKESIGKIIRDIENIRLWDIGKVEQTDFFLQSEDAKTMKHVFSVIDCFR